MKKEGATAAPAKGSDAQPEAAADIWTNDQQK